jgi:hypothetical protein
MQSNLRPARQLLAFAGIVVAFLTIGVIGGRAASPRGCASFESQAGAQNYFLEAGGGVEHPVGKLDHDHDGVACEALDAPFVGYATLGYNKKRNFFYGTVSLPRSPTGRPRYPCLNGNHRRPHGPRLLNVYKVGHDGSAKPIFDRPGLGAEDRPTSGRLLWRGDRKVVVPGRYYAEFEGRIGSSHSGGSECPAFRSATVRLP